MDCSPPGSSVCGHSLGKNTRAGLPCPSPGDRLHPGINPKSPAFQADSLPSELAKSLQSRPTLCDPIDGSPPGSPVPGIFQARTGVGCHFLLQCIKVKNESEVSLPKYYLSCSQMFPIFKPLSLAKREDCNAMFLPISIVKTLLSTRKQVESLPREPIPEAGSGDNQG